MTSYAAHTWMQAGPHPLVSGFYSFYEEVLRQKARALRDSQGLIAIKHTDAEEDKAAPNTENASDKEDTLKEGAPPIHDSLITDHIRDVSADIQRRLLIALESSHDGYANDAGDHDTTLVKHVRYLMAALADEVFLTLPWCGQKDWQRSLLELNLFQSHVAGEVFFERLDGLLDKRVYVAKRDSDQECLTQLYFLCLSLGFRGRYRGSEHNETIAAYKARLFQRLYGHTPTLHGAGRRILSKDPYQHNVSMPYSRGLPDVRRWVMTFAGVLGVYLFVTYILWYKIVRDVDDAIQLIFDQARYLPL